MRLPSREPRHRPLNQSPKAGCPISTASSLRHPLRPSTAQLRLAVRFSQLSGRVNPFSNLRIPRLAGVARPPIDFILSSKSPIHPSAPAPSFANPPRPAVPIRSANPLTFRTAADLVERNPRHSAQRLTYGARRHEQQPDGCRASSVRWFWPSFFSERRLGRPLRGLPTCLPIRDDNVFGMRIAANTV